MRSDMDHRSCFSCHPTATSRLTWRIENTVAGIAQTRDDKFVGVQLSVYAAREYHNVGMIAAHPLYSLRCRDYRKDHDLDRSPFLKRFASERRGSAGRQHRVKDHGNADRRLRL